MGDYPHPFNGVDINLAPGAGEIAQDPDLDLIAAIQTDPDFYNSIESNA